MKKYQAFAWYFWDRLFSPIFSIVKDKNEEKQRFEKDIKFLRRQIEEKDTEERNQIVELEVFIDVLSDIKKYYQNASYVQKGIIIKILFSNIILDHKKSLQIKVKPGLEDLFNPRWWVI